MTSVSIWQWKRKLENIN